MRTCACVLVCVCTWWAGRRGRGQIPRPSVLDFSGNAEYLRGPRGRHLLVRISFQRRFRLQGSFPGPHTSLVQAQGGPWCLTPQEVVSHTPLLSPASRPCPPLFPLPTEDYSSAWSPRPPRTRKRGGEVSRCSSRTQCAAGAGMGREMGCRPGKWQRPAANPAPKKELAYPNSVEWGAAWNGAGKGGVWLEEPPDGRRTQGPVLPSSPGQLPTQGYSAAGIWASSSPLHQQLLVTPRKQS